MLQRGARSSLYVSTFLPECKAEAISEKAVNISITFYCPYHECLMNIVKWFLVVASRPGDCKRVALFFFFWPKVLGPTVFYSQQSEIVGVGQTFSQVLTWVCREEMLVNHRNTLIIETRNRSLCMGHFGQF